MNRREFLKTVLLAGALPPALQAKSKRDTKEKTMIRNPGNLGAFYPASCGEIEKMIAHWNGILDEALKDRSILEAKPRAIIAPHAGYVYSGFTANIAHRILGNARPERVVVIGPSHHVYFEGVSVGLQDRYPTPCGELAIDRPYAEELARRFGLSFVPEAHDKEHSTETQMPFIRHYEPGAKVVELIYGRIDYTGLVPILEAVLAAPETAIVISSDLSHFYTLEQAKRLDEICLTGIANEDVATLDKGCEACGILGIKALVAVAKELGWKTQLLDYRTSADASGDTQRVVGYMSAIVTE
jgi:AmmeMemoRadiSam system protein B